MKTIPLSQGKSAMVDEADYEYLIRWPWHALEVKRKRLPSVWYAARSSTWKGSPVYMHREIARRMGLPQPFKVDHWDANGLNNQRGNLRPCSMTQNNGNRRKESGRSSRFKGVSWFARTRKWVVQIKAHGRRYCLGYFHKEEQAAMAYDRAAKQHFGEFARLNLP